MRKNLNDLQSTFFAFFARIFGGKAPRVGLEIGDHTVRILYEKRGSWQLEQIPLPPGTVTRGVIGNQPVLLKALIELRKRASSNNKRVGVHVSLSSAPIYTQVVQVPRVSREELPAAVELNVQVSAPVPLTELAWGWQVLRPRDEGVDVLAAWISEQTMDRLVTILTQAGFLAATVEPKMLSVARVLRTLAPNTAIQDAYLIVLLDTHGVTLAVLETGQVTFEYRLAWADIQGDAPELAYPRLEKVIRREVPQVARFYTQRTGATLGGVLLGAPTFATELSGTLKKLGYSVRTLSVGKPVFPLHGYAALGGALRGNIFAGEDKELSLLGGQIKEVLRRELVTRIAQFWTFAMPLTLGLLAITTVLTYSFIGRIESSLTESGSAAPPEIIAELEAREARAGRFNNVVQSLYGVQQSLRPKSSQLSSLLAQADSTGVQLIRLNLVLSPGRSSLNGIAQSEAQLLDFKRLLESDKTLQEVNLPIADIRSGSDGISFSMTFKADFAPSGNTSL